MSTIPSSLEASDDLEVPGSQYNIASMLRALGAGAVIASLAAFLLKGWSGSDDLFKFSLLLASTTSIAGIALIIARYLQEMKSPRLLLSLALIAVPINFSIMGAFILYATASTGGVDYPDYLAWTIASPVHALMTTLIGVVLLLPVTWLGFRTLSRGISRTLTISFVVSNLLLLIPIRDPLFVSLMAVALAFVAVFVSADEVRQRVESKTAEGRMALFIQLIPLGVLIGRNVWLYAADNFVLLAGVGVWFLLLRQLTLVLQEDSKLRALMNVISLVPVLLVMPFATGVLESLGLSQSLTVLLAGLCSAAMCYEISMRSKGQTILYRSIAMVVASLTCALVVFDYDAVLSSTLVCAAGVAAFSLGVHWQHKIMTVTGMLFVVFAGLDVVSHIFMFFDLGVWITLMGVGVLAIVLASLVDTYGQSLRGQVVRQGQRYSHWEF